LDKAYSKPKAKKTIIKQPISRELLNDGWSPLPPDYDPLTQGHYAIVFPKQLLYTSHKRYRPPGSPYWWKKVKELYKLHNQRQRALLDAQDRERKAWFYPTLLNIIIVRLTLVLLYRTDFTLVYQLLNRLIRVSKIRNRLSLLLFLRSNCLRSRNLGADSIDEFVLRT